jgi:hypothetical protein
MVASTEKNDENNSNKGQRHLQPRCPNMQASNCNQKDESFAAADTVQATERI